MFDSLKEWSKDVRIELIRREWSYKDLSAATGLSTGYITAIVNARVISLGAMGKVADALGVPLPEELRKKNVS